MTVPSFRSLLSVLVAGSSFVTIPPEREYVYKDALIPRKELIGFSDRINVKLSPDGKYISYLEHVNGVYDLFVEKLADLTIVRATEEARGVADYWWSHYEGSLIYAVSNPKRKRFKTLYYVNVKKTPIVATRLTGTKSNGKIEAMNANYPDLALISSNERDRGHRDIFLVNFTSEQKTLYFKNSEFRNFYFDNDLKLRLATKRNIDKGDAEFYEPISTEDGQITWQLYINNKFSDTFVNVLLGFSEDNSRVYWMSDQNQESRSLYIADFDTPEKKELIYQGDASSTIYKVFFHSTDFKPWSVLTADATVLLDKTYESDFEKLRELGIGSPVVAETTDDFNLWLVYWYSDREPLKFYLYDRARKERNYLFSTEDYLLRYAHARMKAVYVPTRSNLTQLCYQALPRAADPQAGGKANPTPLPTVFRLWEGSVHDNHWLFDFTTQFLTNRGYAVLQCNFRGSLRASKKWAGQGPGAPLGVRITEDLLDAAQWAIDSNLADPEHLAILGLGSWGGFGTLRAMTAAPELFACGIDAFGIADLATYMKSIPQNWRYTPFMAQIGIDNNTEAGRRFIREQSPLNAIENLKRPLLIAQGLKDKRVIREQADKIVESLKNRNVPVTYTVYPDESADFKSLANRQSFMGLIEQFLAECLGGRAEPIGEDLINSMAEIIETGSICVPIRRENNRWIKSC